MARRAAGGPSKSEAIRGYKTSHSEAGPSEIAEALSKDGMKVTAGFVSTVLSNDRRRGRKGRRRAAASRPGRPGRPAGSGAFESLVQAKKMADQMGGINKARAALDALARILG